MDLLENKTTQELYESLLAELAKTSNEIRCAERDIKKAESRLQFALVAINTLIKRREDQ